MISVDLLTSSTGWRSPFGVKSDPTFSAVPLHVSGDLGGIVLPGDKRRVTWDFLKDFPAGLPGR